MERLDAVVSPEFHGRGGQDPAAVLEKDRPSGMAQGEGDILLEHQNRQALVTVGPLESDEDLGERLWASQLWAIGTSRSQPVGVIRAI